MEFSEEDEDTVHTVVEDALVLREDASLEKDADEDAMLLKDNSVVLQVATDLSHAGSDDEDTFMGFPVLAVDFAGGLALSGKTTAGASFEMQNEGGMVALSKG